MPLNKHTHSSSISAGGLLGEGESNRWCWNVDMREAGRQRDKRNRGKRGKKRGKGAICAWWALLRGTHVP